MTGKHWRRTRPTIGPKLRCRFNLFIEHVCFSTQGIHFIRQALRGATYKKVGVMGLG